ncbi:hypothetical protein CDAR_165711 [Caerostris darwini]|uniref:Uncharacterized protein n=1 Tax=Caerostris darwini TaxID=1538125 RepID=A0AAV4W816_9ARAC|nr:hypothetical protein CDAR_165711 [Caerostris darwini]
MSTNNDSKFSSGLLKQGLQRSIRNASLYISRPMPGQPRGKELPSGWLHLQLKNLWSPIWFLLDGFTMCGQSILTQKREGEGRCPFGYAAAIWDSLSVNGTIAIDMGKGIKK